MSPNFRVYPFLSDVIKEGLCSNYSFHPGTGDKYSWNRAEYQCRNNGHNASLVSMESDDEFEFIKNISKKRGQAKGKETNRWYIGLMNSSFRWCWLAHTNACINQALSDVGKWRWAKKEPNNPKTEHCVEMYEGGSYNNIPCSFKDKYQGHGDGGFICEWTVG